MDRLSHTLEGYLDAIYELSDTNSGTRLTDIAAKMSVSKSTASAALNSLAEKNLIINIRYGQIKLTQAGIEIAKLITQKHEILFRFFTEVLKLSSAVSNIDACAIEHVISKDAVIAMQSMLTKL